ncbi:nucleoid-associated protein [Clostridium beijerinckii]|uniref:nucleoid-associated protein n=1 Tax=Clostridium beijerinckii TaxID=1520 RepID=UPI00098BD70C|nr:nucleoid-associated protein [Clostridium beijerinckii]MBA8935508.1 hypothetical protein [Clostridium beijerinckii]NRU39903.1 hypothetical protein [Clostridium beijerinckii]NSA96818.1 hypothetical protein [Clostridium beijerinckii]OOM62569.1 37-kD nucleoid-associated bacterial protein [Clostridium beijerinckii]OOM64891.1 37-kD nucleoid-associated bacterial protein [Clostridium beijerinckii]
MDLNGSISITKAIVHVLNQDKTNGGHFLSDYEIDLDDKLKSLIVKHIVDAFRHESRVFAKFVDDDNVVRECCIKIINDEASFIEESKKISRELYRSMSGTNASSANLLICRYTHGPLASVAIIKLDFNENFYTEKIEENSKTKIIVKLNGNGFNKNQKLRKCAIIDNEMIADKTSNFLLLDTQNGDEVSTYFRIAFLNCELVNNDKVNTKNVIKEVMDFINEKYNEEPSNMIEKTYMFGSKLEKVDNFDIDEVLGTVFEKNEYRDEFKEKIKNKNIDFKFKVDQELVKLRLKNRTIITENGISVKAKSSLFNSNDIFVEPKADGLADIIIKNVRIDKNKF